MTTEIRISAFLWAQVLDLFANHQPGVERVAYLDGYRVDETGYPGVALENQVFVAVTVVVPDANLHPRYYTVSANAISQAGQHLRTLKMTRIAQVHTHGNDWVDHSPTDDDRAYSQRPGAISIVVPYHAENRPDVAECGVHLRTVHGWRKVAPDSVITVVPTVLDYRSNPWTPPTPPTPAPMPAGGTFSRFPVWLKRVLTCRGLYGS